MFGSGATRSVKTSRSIRKWRGRIRSCWPSRRCRRQRRQPGVCPLPVPPHAEGDCPNRVLTAAGELPDELIQVFLAGEEGFYVDALVLPVRAHIEDIAGEA